MNSKSRLIRILLLSMLITISLPIMAQTDQQYINRVTEILTSNPSDVDTIYKAGSYFFNKKNYKMASWYFSSPYLKNHPNYIVGKIKYSRSLLNLKDYKNAYLSYKSLEKFELQEKLRNIVDNDIQKCLEFYSPPSLAKYNSLSLYGGRVTISPSSNKESATYIGGYFSHSSGHSFYEGNIEYLNLIFNEAKITEDYKQIDYVLAYSIFSESFKNKYRFLYHINTLSVIAPDVFSTSSFMFDFYHYYKPLFYIGVEMSYTSFDSGELDSFTNFSTFQLTPKVSFSILGNLSGLVKFNYAILPPESPGELSPPSAFLAGPPSQGQRQEATTNTSSSLDVGLSYFYGNFFSNFTYMIGTETYLLKKEGFLIQNSTDITTSKYSFGAGYSFASSITVSVEFEASKYKDFLETDTYSSQIVSAKSSFSF